MNTNFLGPFMTPSYDLDLIRLFVHASLNQFKKWGPTPVIQHNIGIAVSFNA